MHDRDVASYSGLDATLKATAIMTSPLRSQETIAADSEASSSAIPDAASDSSSELHNLGPFPVKLRHPSLPKSSTVRTNPNRINANGNTQELRPVNRELSLVVSRDNVHEPIRKFDCSNYETCLGIAAVLNWESFTCARCQGKVNRSMLTQVESRVKKDDSLRALISISRSEPPKASS